MNALSALAGMRAIWLLYLRGRWDLLEDLGIDRNRLEPALKQFNYGDPLTIRQAQQLYKKVPELVEASRELRLAYALKQLDRPRGPRRRKQMSDMVIYHAEVSSAVEAADAVKFHTQEIQAAGGTIEAGFGRGQSGAIVMVKLPASLQVDPANLLPGSGLRFGRVRAMVVPFPQNMGEDPRLPKDKKE